MTDEREPKLSQAYRELGREEPPRALDDAILAAARRAERTHPAPLLSPGVGRPARERWTFPLAAAAVIMLSVGVVMHLQQEQPGIDGLQVAAEKAPPAPAAVAEAPKPEAPKPEDTMIARAPAAAKAAKAAEALPPPIGEAARETARSEARGASSGPFVQAPPVVASAPAAAPAPATPAPAAASPAPARKSMAMQRAEEGMRDRADGAERQALSEATAKRSQDAGEAPEKWLERIAELRRAGKHDEADKALAEFRQRHPGYRIPEAMLEKVERKEN
jgi:hypothetical protein